MAQRPLWRGHLRLALVSCPVALYNARHERETTRFNMINPATGNRIKMVSQDAETGQEVARRETVKGYEYAKGQYVIITDEDLESVRVESSGMMKVEKFVDAGVDRSDLLRFQLLSGAGRQGLGGRVCGPARGHPAHRQGGAHPHRHLAARADPGAARDGRWSRRAH